MKHIYAILILILFTQQLCAQKHEIGAEIGFGKSFQLENIKYAQFWQSTNNSAKFGISYSYIPFRCFAVNTGLFYLYHGWVNSSMSFIQTPIGIDIIAGKKVQGIFGTGFNIKYVMAFSGDDLNYDFKRTHTDFQLGLYFETGIKIHISAHSGLLIKALFETDLTPLYYETSPSHTDVFGNTYIKYSDLLLSVGYRYSF